MTKEKSWITKPEAFVLGAIGASVVSYFIAWYFAKRREEKVLALLAEREQEQLSESKDELGSFGVK